MASFDDDVVIIGSGFGGSVAALRAAEKGCRVGVMESGGRWKDEDLPESQWHLLDFLWFPDLTPGRDDACHNGRTRRLGRRPGRLCSAMSWSRRHRQHPVRRFAVKQTSASPPPGWNWTKGGPECFPGSA
jgi:choline dehydrogenase-like flavoprotein